MLKIQFFQMALNPCELLSNSFKIVGFPKKSQKVAQRVGGLAPLDPYHPAAGGSASRPPPLIRLSYTSLLNMPLILHIYRFGWDLSSHLPLAKSWLCANTQALASDLSIYIVFVPQKIILSKNNCDDVIACGLSPSP